MTLTEQRARHEATAQFLRGGKEIARLIAEELRRLEREEKEVLEKSYQDRCTKPTTQPEQDNDNED